MKIEIGIKNDNKLNIVCDDSGNYSMKINEYGYQNSARLDDRSRLAIVGVLDCKDTMANKLSTIIKIANNAKRIYD